MFPRRRLAFQLAMRVVCLAALPLLVVSLFDLLPSSPGRAVLGPLATEEDVRAWEEKRGYRGTFVERVKTKYESLLSLDLGLDLDGQPVLLRLGPKATSSLALGGLGILLAVVFSFAYGIVASSGNGKNGPNKSIRTMLGVPALVATLLAAQLLREAFPNLSLSSFTLDDNQMLRLIPASLIALQPACVLAVVLSGSLREIRSSGPYVFGKSLGMGWLVREVHVAFRGASAEWLRQSANLLGRILLATFAVEIAFSVEGVGTLLQGSVADRDLNTLQAIVLMNGALVVLAQMCADLLLAFLDRRPSGIEFGGLGAT